LYLIGSQYNVLIFSVLSNFFYNALRVYFVFFEEGIVLQNSKKEDEYYFIDQNNELKNTFFKNETLCGALMITNTDAKAFVRNGEFRPDQMIYYLNPKVWKSIFYEE
jgi:hypothetical protein